MGSPALYFCSTPNAASEFNWFRRAFELDVVSSLNKNLIRLSIVIDIFVSKLLLLRSGDIEKKTRPTQKLQILDGLLLQRKCEKTEIHSCEMSKHFAEEIPFRNDSSRLRN